MLTIEKVDTTNKNQVNRFVKIPFRLYDGHPQWVPPLMIDVRMQLNKKKHPYYEHSDADFFMVIKDGREVGRIAALENKRFNDYHKSRQAQFYLFDCEDDQEAANALFETVFDWAKKRGLDTVVGPKGFGPMDGYGIQVEGFEHRQMMNMMNYNYPYYSKLVEAIGFEKEVDFVSCYLHRDAFCLPERVHKIAERVLERGRLGVKTFETKKELRAWADKIGKAYNNTFVNNWEYYPLTEREVAFVVQNLLLVADPRLIKVITHKEDIIGFLFGFPDVSLAFQRARGKLNPITLLGFLREMKRTEWISLNGAGVLPEFQGLGGNALLYTEMQKTLQDYHYIHADLTQVAETTRQMRADLINVGGKAYKNHRVYHRSVG